MKIYTPDVLYKPHLWGYAKEFIYLARLRMGLSGLNAHRKQYHFIDNSSCPKYNFKIENTPHYLLLCTSYAAHRAEMFQSLSQLLPNFQQEAHSQSRNIQKSLTEKLVFGTLKPNVDKKVFEAVANFIKNTDRFS